MTHKTGEERCVLASSLRAFCSRVAGSKVGISWRKIVAEESYSNPGNQEAEKRRAREGKAGENALSEGL